MDEGAIVVLRRHRRITGLGFVEKGAGKEMEWRLRPRARSRSGSNVIHYRWLTVGLGVHALGRGQGQMSSTAGGRPLQMADNGPRPPRVGLWPGSNVVHCRWLTVGLQC